MNLEEFSEPEREGKLGISLWPDWHFGVLSMYGAHIALNHFAGFQKINVVKLDDLIDYPSANTEDVDTKMHIHVFHGDDMFSKFEFKLGKYDSMNVDDNQARTVKYYCLKLALEAKRTSYEDLKKLLDQQNLNKL